MLTIPQITTLLAIASIPWVVKPVYGILSDYYPINGLRRKPYLIASSMLASLGWLYTSGADTYGTVLLSQLCAALGIAASDVFADGLAVQKSTAKTAGRIQSVCWGSRSAGAIATGAVGGALLRFITPQQVFLATSILPLLVLATVVMVEEKPSARRQRGISHFLALAVRTYANERMLWWVALFLFLWWAAPSFGTPLFFFLRDTVGLGAATLGLLQSVSSIGGVLGAVLFWTRLDKCSLRSLFLWLILINVAFTLLFYLVTGVGTALAIYFVNGILGVIIVIASMRLIVGACPKGIEATTFALFTGIVNLGSSVVAPYVGGQLYAIIGYRPLILVSAVMGLIPLLAFKKITKNL